MKKAILTILILMTLCLPVNAFDICREIPTDKRLHGLLFYAITDTINTHVTKDPIEAFLCVNAIGISKELLDQAYGGKFDTNDIMANNVGFLTWQIIHMEW